MSTTTEIYKNCNKSLDAYNVYKLFMPGIISVPRKECYLFLQQLCLCYDNWFLGMKELNL